MDGLFSEADLDPEMIKLERAQMERERLERIQNVEKEENKEVRSFDRKLYIIDGYSVIYRSYFAFISSPLKDINGKNCSAYHGFFNTLFSLLNNYDIDYFAVAMDEKGPTFRHDMYPEYKATRDKTPDDLHAQIPDIRQTLEKMGITVLSQCGYEADDIIASIAKKAEREGIETVMFTGDKDLCQLVNDHIYALRPAKKGEHGYVLMDKDRVKTEYGVYPDLILDYLTMLGDAADNVPGIKGIGEKSAEKLLTEYLTLDGIYRHLDSLSPAIRKKMEAGKDAAVLSRKLITLNFEALPESFDFSSLDASRIDRGAAAEDFKIRRMNSLLTKAEKKSIGKSIAVSSTFEPEPSLLTDMEKENLVGPGKYSMISLSDADKCFSEIATFKGGTIVLELLTDGFEDDSEILGFAFSSEEKLATYVSTRHEARKDLIDFFDRYLASGKLRIVMHNAKFCLKHICRIGSDIRKILFDTQIAAWMLDSNTNQYSLYDLSSKFFATTLLNIDDLKEKRKDSVSTIKDDLLMRYTAQRADYVFRLYRILERRLHEKGVADTYNDFELPLIRILAQMESEGIFLSEDRMKDMNLRLGDRLDTIVKEIYRIAGHEFNINSTQQLATVLFDELGLTSGKKTQRGYSTDTATLEAIKGENEIVGYVLEYRQLNKLKTTYVDTLPLLRDVDGRIHTSFLQTGTATGRLSSRNPNLQNIPIRTDEGRIIRDAFVPGEGRIFLSADYSQIELVVLSHMTGDVNLQHAFTTGLDVHKFTASVIFSKDLDDVDAHERRIAKTINFGIMYGMSAFRLSNELGITRSEASDFIKRYFERYSGVRNFVDATVKEAEENGKVVTMFGHQRDIVGIKSSNKTEKAAAERVAVNTVIQGTAAEIMKKAMIDIDCAIAESGLDAKMLLQVHDELIFEVSEADKDKLKDIVKEKMENAVKLSVPLRASLEFGHSWGEMH